MVNKVLIVDPDLEDRDLMAGVMADNDWEVLKAITFKDGLLYVSNYQVDLVLTNNLIPTLYDGKRFITDLRKLSEKTYIIIVSAVKSVNTISDFLSMGADDYMVKPFDRETLLWKLSVRFKNIVAKDFARINLPDNPELSQCFFELHGIVAGLSEDHADIFLKYYMNEGTEFKIDPAFFNNMGLDKQSISLEIMEIQKLPVPIYGHSFVARCRLRDMTDHDTISIRRWLLTNSVKA